MFYPYDTSNLHRHCISNPQHLSNSLCSCGGSLCRYALCFWLLGVGLEMLKPSYFWSFIFLFGRLQRGSYRLSKLPFRLPRHGRDGGKNQKTQTTSQSNQVAAARLKVWVWSKLRSQGMVERLMTSWCSAAVSDFSDFSDGVLNAAGSGDKSNDPQGIAQPDINKSASDSNKYSIYLWYLWFHWYLWCLSIYLSNLI